MYNKNDCEKLIDAAAKGDDVFLRIQICDGVDLNSQTYGLSGNSALMQAAKHNHKTCVRMLIEAGADINLKNKNNQTALNLAYSNCKKREQGSVAWLDMLEIIQILQTAEERSKQNNPYSIVNNKVVVKYVGNIKNKGELNKIFDFEARTVTQTLGKEMRSAQSFDSLTHSRNEILKAHSWLKERSNEVPHPYRIKPRHIRRN